MKFSWQLIPKAPVGQPSRAWGKNWDHPGLTHMLTLIDINWLVVSNIFKPTKIAYFMWIGWKIIPGPGVGVFATTTTTTTTTTSTSTTTTTNNNKQQQTTTNNNKQQQTTTNNNNKQQTTTNNNKQQQQIWNYQPDKVRRLIGTDSAIPPQIPSATAPQFHPHRDSRRYPWCFPRTGNLKLVAAKLRPAHSQPGQVKICELLATIWLWHSQFAMENHHCEWVNQL